MNNYETIAANPAYTAIRADFTLTSWMKTVSDTLTVWSNRAATRRRMAMLSERLMDDAGLSRQDIEQETMKHFWQE